MAYQSGSSSGNEMKQRYLFSLLTVGSLYYLYQTERRKESALREAAATGAGSPDADPNVDPGDDARSSI